MAFITINDVKTEIGMDAADTTYDSLLTALVSAILNMLDWMTNRTWAETEHTEYYDGRDFPTKVFLKNFPVTSKTSVTLYDDPDWEYSSADLISSDDYQVDLERGVIYYNSRFFQSDQNIKVIYTAGYTDSTIPAAVKQILIRQAAHWFKQARNSEWDVSSKANPGGAGSTSFSTLSANLLPDFVAMVEKEKRVS